MPASSEKQRKPMAMAEHTPSKIYDKNRGVLKMNKAKLHDFARKPMKARLSRKPQ